MNFSRFIRPAALGTALLALAASRAGAADPAKITLNVGVLKIAALADVYAAQQLGFFEKQGLEVVTTTANNGNDLITALESNRLDIALAIPGVAMQAREKGYKVSLVFQNELAHATAPDTGALIVRADSPITTIKGLVGKKIAHSGIGTQAWAAVRAVEQKNNVDPASVTDLEISYPQMRSVLLQGQIDAVAVVDPFTSQILNAKEGRVLSYFYVDSVPNQPVGAFWATDENMIKNKDAIRKFQVAMHQALTYMSTHPTEAKKLIAEYTGLKPEFTAQMNPIRWSDKVNLGDWHRTAQMLVLTGATKTMSHVEDLIPKESMHPGE